MLYNNERHQNKESCTVAQLMWDSSADESEKPLHPEFVTGPLESERALVYQFAFNITKIK